MNQYQFSPPPITKTNKIIIIATIACFILDAVMEAVGAFRLPPYLGLSAAGMLKGLVFQLLTYPFIEIGLFSCLFSCLIVWFIGSQLEQQWGSKIYLRFLLINVLGVGIIYSLVNILFFYGTTPFYSPLHGLGVLTFAMLISYSLLYPDRQMLMLFFPVRAQTFCWILVAIEAYMALKSGIAASWAHLLAMGISFLLIRFQTQPLVKKALNSSFESKKRSKNRLYVVKDEDQKPPKFWQ